MDNGLLGVVRVVRDEVGGGKSGDGDTEVEESVAVSGECGGIGLTDALGEGRGWVGRVGPIIVGFGIKVVGSTWTTGAGESCEGRGSLGQEPCGSAQDTIVIDGCYVGPGGGLGLGQEKAWGEEEWNGLRE
jgi:hypothetical protein